MGAKPQPNSKEDAAPPLLNDVVLRCGRCGYIGPAVPQAPGKAWLEALFWIAFVVPGFLYSLWRLFGRRYFCPRCQAADGKVTVSVGRKVAMVLRALLLCLFVASLAVLALVWNASQGP